MKDVAASSSDTLGASPAPTSFEAPPSTPFPARSSRATTLRPLPIAVPELPTFLARNSHIRTIGSGTISRESEGRTTDVDDAREEAGIRLNGSITPPLLAGEENEEVDTSVGELSGLLGGAVDPGKGDYLWKTSAELRQASSVREEDSSDEEWVDSREIPSSPMTVFGVSRESRVDATGNRRRSEVDRGHFDDAEVMSDNLLESRSGARAYVRVEDDSSEHQQEEVMGTTSSHPYTTQTQIPSDVSLPYPHDIDPITGQRFDYIPPTPSPSAPAFHSRSSSSSSLNLPPETSTSEFRRDLNSRPNLARLASEESKLAPLKTPGRSARKFFSKLLTKTDGSGSQDPHSPSSTQNPVPPLRYHTRAIPSSSSPYRGSMLFGSRSHGRSESLPSPGINTTDAVFGPSETTEASNSRSRLFPPMPHSPLVRSSSLQSMPTARAFTPNLGSTTNDRRIPNSSVIPRMSSNPTFHSRTTPTAGSTKLPGPKVTTLKDIGVSLFGLTLPISNSQPLCGALLDNYILIGTTNGLDFLPIPLPGSLPMMNHGRKRKETRKPISLIKRTRFKQLAVLAERSNILLAIAGRNDHIRVYSLDSIRLLIEKKMSELDPRDGYHYIPNPLLLDREPILPQVLDKKGKGKVESASRPSASDRPPISDSDILGVNDRSECPQVDALPLDPTEARLERRRGSTRSGLEPRTPKAPSRSEGIGDLAAFLRDTGPDETEFMEPLAYSKDVLGDNSSSASKTSNKDKAVVGDRIPVSASVSDRRIPREAVFGNKDGISSSRDFPDFLHGGPEMSKVDMSRASARLNNRRQRADTLPSVSRATRSPIPTFHPPSNTVTRQSSVGGSFEIVPRPSQEEALMPRTSISLPSDLSRLSKSNSLRDMVPREASSQRLRRAARASILDMAQLIRQGPESPRPSTPETEEDLSTLGMISNLLNDDYIPRAIPRIGGSPNNRASKRWTMSGMGSLLRSATDLSHVSPATSAALLPTTFDQSASLPAGNLLLEDVNMNVVVQPLASTPLPPHDFKERALASQQSLNNPSLPAFSQIPSEIPPNVNLSNTLEFVKLARTKGSKLLRAVETSKRTYLAVLTGDQGERIELFTGSRNISLSLNRTFVLPESPRTIEFQLQGDDLIDIYLVYPDSVFALEPTTVRVREVGLGRGERRIRRERERRMREIASTSTMDPAEQPVEPPSPLSNLLHPADPARAEQISRPTTPDPTSNANSDPEAIGLGIIPEALRSRSSSPVLPAPADSLDQTQSSSSIEEVEVVVDSSSTRSSGPTAPSPPLEQQTPPIPPRSKSSLPFSTFQQLPFIPPLPSSLLSAAWIIPPLYSDVEAAPSIAVPFSDLSSPIKVCIRRPSEIDSETNFSPPTFDQSFPRLLPPISLLGGHRAAGPPGIFFVSKSKHISGIVTGDGRSVIRKPLVWNGSTEAASTAEAYQKIEIIPGNGGNQTIIIGLGSREVKGILLGGSIDVETPVSDAATIAKLTAQPGEIRFLGTHHASSQLFYSELMEGRWRVFCVASV